MLYSYFLQSSLYPVREMPAQQNIKLVLPSGPWGPIDPDLPGSANSGSKTPFGPAGP
jgi:hypothetical protein